MILCLLLAVAATTSVLTVASLATNCAKEQNDRERALKAKYSFEGVIAKVEQSFGNETISLGNTTAIVCGGLTWNVTTTDHSPIKAKSYLVTGTTTLGGRSYTRSTVIGNPYVKAPFKYVVTSDGNATLPKAFMTGPPGKGNVYVNQNLSASTVGMIDGSLTTTSSSPPLNLTVTGTTKLNAAPLAVVKPKNGDYDAAKTSSVDAATLNGITFAQPYELWHREGNLTLKGVVSGTGTIYVHGSVTIDGDLTYLDANSCIAVLCSGNIDIPIGATNIVGYFYTEGNVKFDKILAVTFGPGALVFSGNLTTNVALTMLFDDRVKKSEKMGYDLKLPGYWP